MSFPYSIHPSGQSTDFSRFKYPGFPSFRVDLLAVPHPPLKNFAARKPAFTMSEHLERTHTAALDAGDIEIGVSDALQRHLTRHVVPPKRVSQRKLNFEHKRPRVLRECMAEATGVFFYVLPGIASVCTFTLNGASPLGVTAFSSIFQIGWVRTKVNISSLDLY